jgi:hypothetical protein
MKLAIKVPKGNTFDFKLSGAKKYLAIVPSGATATDKPVESGKNNIETIVMMGYSP